MNRRNVSSELTRQRTPSVPRTAGPQTNASPDAITIRTPVDEDPDKGIAKALLNPTVTGATAIRSAHRSVNGVQNGASTDALIEELSKQCAEVADGKMERPEAVLTSQAHTLDALFSDLVRRAYSHRDLEPFEKLMRLALKVQNQSRATIETLATLKSPPLLFARQANVNTGNQQINNEWNSTRPETAILQTPESPVISDFTQNELLDRHHG